VVRTFKITLAYDGTNYAGWQFQPNRPTIQGTFQAALARVAGETIQAIASSRTDAGVHALGQVVSLETQCMLPAERLLPALNANLPDDIAVLAVDQARGGFHAIRDALRKQYRYVIHDGPLRDVFGRHYAWHCRQTLDVAAMQRAAAALVGTHDFRSFESAWPSRQSSIRTVYDLTVARGSDDRHRVTIDITANGFLYKMVRAIVGTLVEVGRHAEDDDWPARVLARRDRAAAGPTAPPHGLFLMQVWFSGQAETALAGADARWVDE
jgi:tRNA pseudouridine38-40 synthase